MSARYLRYVHASGGGAWARQGDDGRLEGLDRAPWEAGVQAEEARPLDPARPQLLAPATPSKIVCVGRNYAAHAAELGNEVPSEPLLFLKPPSALVGHGAPIELPPGIGEVHHESELALVLGRPLDWRATEAECLEAIFGLSCANDVTARTLQRAENKFTRAKGFDTFCPLGPALVTGLDPTASRRVACYVDGALRQEGETSAMIHAVGPLLRFIASVMRLEAGDLILTGTPAGVGPFTPGQRVRVEVEGVGALENPAVVRG